MTKTRDEINLDRRAIVTGLATVGAVSYIAPTANAQVTEKARDEGPASSSSEPPAGAAAHERTVPPDAPLLEGRRPGSDFLVDVIKSLDIDYFAANPGSSFRGLHESLVNYGGNRKPELLTCLHEEISVGIAHGYARASGKPMGVMMHATVGVQHGSMAIYNAFCDRAPMLMISANLANGAHRRPNIEWLHSAQDGAAIVRDFTKWDDQPGSLPHAAESLVRGYRLSTAVPQGPVLVVLDGDLQEEPIEKPEHLKVPRLAPNVPPVADAAALDELAQLLIGAESPVILADRYARGEAGVASLIQLAELLGAAVCDLGARFNFPNTHPLNHSGRMRSAIASADVILALEPTDLWGALGRLYDQNVRTEVEGVSSNAKIASIALDNVILRSNFQDFGRYRAVDLAITADAERSIPLLIERVNARIDANARTKANARAAELKTAYQALRQRDREAARVAWDVSPITTGRLCLELWEVIKNEDWALPCLTYWVSQWPQRLWDMTKPQHYTGSLGAGGIGGALSGAVGAALAHREHGRITVNIQPDGDFMYGPGALWTAAHHKIPLLTVMHNNRAYHQEIMHVQRMAARNERGLERVRIGSEITNPDIDYAQMARSMGVWAVGPITDPDKLRPALLKALAVVKRGEPALVDVVTQPR